MPKTADVPGWVYTIHFDQPIGGIGRPRMTAQHYTGWAEDNRLVARLLEHKAGAGSRIMAAVGAAGIRWHVAALERGTRRRERSLKGHGAARRCPTCRARGELCQDGRAVRLTGHGAVMIAAAR